MKFDYDLIPLSLRAGLNSIPPVYPAGKRGSLEPYWPCALLLKNGRELPRAYVVDRVEFLSNWSEHEEQVSIGDVLELRSSTYRIPAVLAQEIYDVGESGMGYFVFELEFHDGQVQSYATGDLVDFVPLPDGKSMNQIVKVFPGRGRDSIKRLEGLRYAWCLVP